MGSTNWIHSSIFSLELESLTQDLGGDHDV